MAADRLVGVRAKIERANHHINDLDRLVQEFRNSKPYALIREFNRDRIQHTFKIKVISHPPINLSLIVGDVVHNLRSALDHLAWQLVLANSQAPGKWTYFPICETAAKYKSECPGKVKGMSAGAVGAIDAIQPYQGGCDDLWKLHQLNITDKHSLLLFVGYGTIGSTLTLGGPDQRSGTITFDMGFDPVGKIFEDGAEIGGIGGAIIDENLKANVDLRFEVAFDDPGIVKGKAVVPFLHQLSDLVDSIVTKLTPFM